MFNAHTTEQSMTATKQRTPGPQPFVVCEAVTKVITLVETDGMGSYRARCSHCDWHSIWFEKGKQSPESYRNALAVREAKEHGEHHIARAALAAAEKS